MQQIILNFDGVTTWNALYDFLKTTLFLTENCRRSLDAIWRCLRGSFTQPTVLLLENLAALPRELYPVIPVLQQMFRDLEAEEGLVTVEIADKPVLDALLTQPEPEEEALYF